MVAVFAYASLIGAIWWAIAVSLLVLSFSAAVVFSGSGRAGKTKTDLPSVTVIVPIKDFDPHFESAQASVYAQRYPNLEIVVTAAEDHSPALEAMHRLQKNFSGVDSRIVQSRVNKCASPKLNNIWTPLAQAQNDLILTKDSNVILAPDDVASFVGHFNEGVGLVSTIPIAVRPESAAAWIEAWIINCYYARMLMLARALGLGFGCGKIMLFRRSDIERAGGFEALSEYLGEDAALANAISGLGLRTVMADRVSPQYLGLRHLGDVWNRQLRWKSIWRVQVPVIFVASLLGSSILAATAAAAAAPLLGVSPLLLASGTLAAWFSLEALLCFLKGWPLSIWSPFAFLGREVLDVLVWLRALTVSEVSWAGVKYRVTKPAPAAQFDAALAPTLPQGAGTNDSL